MGTGVSTHVCTSHEREKSCHAETNAMQGMETAGVIYNRGHYINSFALTAGGQRVCPRYISIDNNPQAAKHSLSKGVVQELVAPQVALQPTDVQTERVVQTVETRQLHREAHFVARIVLSITIDGIEADGRWDL